MGFSDGVIQSLVICAFFSAPQIADRLDLPGTGLHDDHRTVLGLVVFQLPQQGVMGNILNIDVNGGDYIVPVLGLNDIVQANGLPLSLGDLLF